MIRSLPMRAFLLFLSILPLASAVRAGAWTQKKHAYFFKLSTNYFFTNKEFDHKGNRVAIFSERPGFENASFRDFNLNAYLKYVPYEQSHGDRQPAHQGIEIKVGKVHRIY